MTLNKEAVVGGIVGAAVFQVVKLGTVKVYGWAKKPKEEETKKTTSKKSPKSAEEKAA